MVLGMDLAARILDDIDKTPVSDHRPLVTLSYAQSLDGSITTRQGEMLVISGQEAARLTHQLRSYHDCILVGLGTVLADDPRLTVRLVEGDDPQPVILDSQLRIPLNTALLQDREPWIATTDRADPEKAAELEARGVRLLRMPADPQGRVNLPDLLRCLKQLGVSRLMVEGGARVITSFISQQMVDFVVLTLSPIIVGGFQAVQLPSLELEGSTAADFPRLGDFAVEKLGADLVLWGRMVWP